MKKLYSLLSVVLLTVSAFAQAPEKMSYQAVIRDASNVLVANQLVGMQLSILQGSATGTAVYIETQTPTTNINGLVSLEIGTGSVVSGSFSIIDWSAGPYFLKTETAPTGGTIYTITGTSQLLSVPYALHANTADSIIGGTSITETDPVFGASIANSITTTDTANWNNHTIDTDTKLTELEVDSFVSNNGYLTSADSLVLANVSSNLLARINADSLIRFIYDTTLSGQLRDTTAFLRSLIVLAGTDDQFISLYGDTIALQRGGYISIKYINDSIASYNLKININNVRSINNLDSITTVQSNIADSAAAIRADIPAASTDDQALSISVTKGSITLEDGGTIQLGDSSSTNEIQAISRVGSTVTLVGGGTYTDSTLTEATVDGFVANNGYSTGAHTTDTQLDSAGVAALGFVANPSGVWLPITLQNNWVYYAGFATPQYTKDHDGTVHVKGTISSGTFADATVLFNLPVDHRPSERRIMQVNNNGVWARVDIMTNGDVICYSLTSNGWLNLEFSFKP